MQEVALILNITSLVTHLDIAKVPQRLNAMKNDTIRYFRLIGQFVLLFHI